MRLISLSRNERHTSTPALQSWFNEKYFQAPVLKYDTDEFLVECYLRSVLFLKLNMAFLKIYRSTNADSPAYCLWDDVLTLTQPLITNLKRWLSLPHQCSIKAKPSQIHWPGSLSSDFSHNKHVIGSWLQLEQDADLDSCALKCLHYRIPQRYQM